MHSDGHTTWKFNATILIDSLRIEAIKSIAFILFPYNDYLALWVLALVRIP